MNQTPFQTFHVERDASFVDFNGWRMPIMYQSIHQEHHQVRTSGGLFDVSHMGRLKLSGRHARKFLETILTRRISDMEENTCRYSLICNDTGGTLDDVLVYRFGDHWLLVVNAGNRKKIIEHLQAQVTDHVVTIEDQTMSTAMVAVQGPKVMQLVGRFSSQVPALKRYSFCIKNLLVVKMVISRTGYTGEDGVEVIMNANMANMAIKLLMENGSADESSQLQPAGLGARDTLRMEAGMPLYGHELDEQTDPFAAGLDFAVCLNKDEYDRGIPFLGQQALKKIHAGGPGKKLVGLQFTGKRTARQGMAVARAGRAIGAITSACLSPTLGHPIAMAYVQPDSVGAGDAINVTVGSKIMEGQVVKLPFYKRTCE